MKKTIVNFKNSFYVLYFFALCCLVSCQKENIQPTINKVTTEANTQEIDAAMHELDLSELATQMNSNARTGASVIMNEMIEVDREGPYKLSIDVEDLPNPRTHRIEVRVIPFDKPTDLVTQAWNRNQPRIYTDIKESRNPGMEVDFVKFRASDILANETNAIISIEWEGVGNKFELKIYAIPVDCEEDRPRNQGDVGIDYQPVCGCDGRTYFDETSAYNHGITSWERGQCRPNVNIPVEGVWESLNPEIAPHILEYFKDCFTIFTTTPGEEGVRSMLCPGDEGYDGYDTIIITFPGEKSEEERTFTVVDEKKDGFPLIQPAEKWSVQVNIQGELEIVKTNGTADKDKEEKKDRTTVLHRYKRIK